MSLFPIHMPLLAQLEIEVPELLGPVELAEPFNWPLWTTIGGMACFLLVLFILSIVRARRRSTSPAHETLEQLRARVKAIGSAQAPDERRLLALSTLAREVVARHTGRPAHGLTPAEISVLLPEQASGLADALRACEQARFAGETVDATAVAEQVKVAINALILLRDKKLGKGPQQ